MRRSFEERKRNAMFSAVLIFITVLVGTAFIDEQINAWAQEQDMIYTAYDITNSTVLNRFDAHGNATGATRIYCAWRYVTTGYSADATVISAGDGSYLVVGNYDLTNHAGVYWQMNKTIKQLWDNGTRSIYINSSNSQWNAFTTSHKLTTNEGETYKTSGVYQLYSTYSSGFLGSAGADDVGRTEKYINLTLEMVATQGNRYITFVGKSDSSFYLTIKHGEYKKNIAWLDLDNLYMYSGIGLIFLAFVATPYFNPTARKVLNLSGRRSYYRRSYYRKPKKTYRTKRRKYYRRR